MSGNPLGDRPAGASTFARIRSHRAFGRMISLSLALGSGTVLGLARWLQPAAEGHATHTQLGLGQCSFLAATGQPCPMCGMTTSFAMFADLRPVAAVINQPFSLVMFGITVAVFAIATAEVVQPRDRWSRLGRRLAPWDPVLGIGFLALMGAGWMYKIAMMSGWF